MLKRFGFGFVFQLLLATAVLLAFSRLAYAQTSNPVPVTTITPLVGIGMVLGLLLGFLNQGVTSGTILTFGVPSALKTTLALLASFLGGFIPQFQQMTTVTSSGIFLAIFMGVSALLTYSAGATVRLHQETGKATVKRMAAAAKTLAVLCGLALVTQTTACASLPAWAKAFKDVVADLGNHDTLEQIEQDVAVDLNFSGPINTIVSTFVIDAIDEAIALGLIPAADVPYAVGLEKTEAAKLVQMGGHLPTSVLLRHHKNEQALLASWALRGAL
jgi:hypothetical protein